MHACGNDGRCSMLSSWICRPLWANAPTSSFIAQWPVGYQLILHFEAVMPEPPGFERRPLLGCPARAAVYPTTTSSGQQRRTDCALLRPHDSGHPCVMCDPSKVVSSYARRCPVPPAPRSAVSAFLAGLGSNDCSSFPLAVQPRVVPALLRIMPGADGAAACKVGTHCVSPPSSSQSLQTPLSVSRRQKQQRQKLTRSMLMTPRSCPSFRHQCRPRPARPRPPDGTSQPPSYTSSPAQTDSPGLRLAPSPQPRPAAPLHVAVHVREAPSPISAAHTYELLALAHRHGWHSKVKRYRLPAPCAGASGEEDQ